MTPKTASTPPSTDDSTISLQAALERYFPFISEVRRRLFFAAAIFLIAAIIGFISYERIVSFFLRAYELQGVNIVFTSPFQFFNLAVSTGIITGIVVVFPLIVYQVLSFLKPALNSQEYRLIVRLTPLAFLLFTIGLGYGAFMMRYVIKLFYEKSLDLQIGNILDVSLLLSQILITSALMGLAFQFPIVISILIRLHLVSQHLFASQRTLAYATSLLFAALLPPTDLLSLGLLTLPLVILFELTLLFNRQVKHPARKKIINKHPQR